MCFFFQALNELQSGHFWHWSTSAFASTVSQNFKSKIKIKTANLNFRHIRRNFEVVALWDEDGSELENEAESLNISIYSSFEDDVLLNKEIGLLIILCPPIHHAQIAVKALGIAKHVYVHPPCATGALQTLRMVQSASYYPNLCAFVGSLRSLPAAVELKKCLKYVGSQISHCDVRLSSPSLIGSSRYSWKCSEEMGGGVLNFFGSQLIDLVLFTLGQRASKVNASFRTVQKKTAQIGGIRHITADDVASLVLETDQDCLVTIYLSAVASNCFSQEVTMTGDQGQLTLRNANLFGRKFSLDNQDQEEELYLDSNANNEDKELPQLYLRAYECLFDRLKEAVKVDQEEKSDLATFEDALHISEIISAARQSNVEKSWCRVPPGALLISGDK